jgi:hypothetical protein
MYRFLRDSNERCVVCFQVQLAAGLAESERSSFVICTRLEIANSGNGQTDTSNLFDKHLRMYADK